jgi:phage terminase small subunit
MAKNSRTTTKKVQASENRPAPELTFRPETDDEPWDADCLTLKQKLFVEYYVGKAHGNASKAARLAGYASENDKALRVTAIDTRDLPNVQKAIARALAAKRGSDPDSVRLGIVEIASASAADYLSRDPKTDKLVMDLEKLAETGMLGCVSEIREEGFEDGNEVVIVKRKLKLYDRLKALELLAKMNGQFIERRDITSGGKPLAVKVLRGVSMEEL